MPRPISSISPTKISPLLLPRLQNWSNRHRHRSCLLCHYYCCSGDYSACWTKRDSAARAYWVVCALFGGGYGGLLGKEGGSHARNCRVCDFFDHLFEQMLVIEEACCSNGSICFGIWFWIRIELPQEATSTQSSPRDKSVGTMPLHDISKWSLERVGL